MQDSAPILEIDQCPPNPKESHAGIYTLVLYVSVISFKNVILLLTEEAQCARGTHFSYPYVLAGVLAESISQDKGCSTNIDKPAFHVA